jgi:hypothetical protein
MRMAFWFAIATAILVVGWLTIGGPRPKGTTNTVAVEAGEALDDTVAVLHMTYRAEWEDTGMPTRAGSTLPPGRLVLKAGYAQIEFYNGAMVILEGPADFKIVSRTEGYCARGKLRATVPPQAQGFTIGSPALDLVDRGTEFGLDVGEKTKVHVFNGKVDLYPPAGGQGGSPRRELTTGQGMAVDGPGPGRLIASEPADFLTADELAARSAVDLETRRREWAAVTEEVRRDPALLIQYTFRPEHPWSRTLKNEAPGRPAAHDGAVVGGQWGPGRWPGKQGLEYKQKSDRVRLTVPGEFSDLTLAAWVRPDALPNQNNSLMMADGWEEGEPHWQIGSDGTVIFSVKGPPGYQPAPNVRGPQYRAYEVITPERFGYWVHLAVVYDQKAQRVTHYLDGRPVAELPIELTLPLRVGDAELGNWNAAGFKVKVPVRNFNGCIDDFLMYSRPLRGDEIERLYARGRPPL